MVKGEQKSSYFDCVHATWLCAIYSQQMFEHDSFFFSCGAFLQVIWKSSSISGCFLLEIPSHFTFLFSCLFPLQHQSVLSKKFSHKYFMEPASFITSVWLMSPGIVKLFFFYFNCFINMTFCLTLPLESNIYPPLVPQLNHMLPLIKVYLKPILRKGSLYNQHSFEPREPHNFTEDYKVSFLFYLGACQNHKKDPLPVTKRVIQVSIVFA